ncbi:hypothetical protein M0Q97_13310, partial [Candidatus Dojkabacteria bacterium]|nr:hypothetical protein [Candidatus Dojkabacteria bacterium]
MKLKGYLLTGFTALFLEGWAAYFSIFGWVALIGKSFLGAAIGIELAKVVMVGILYNWRKDVSHWIKISLWI